MITTLTATTTDRIVSALLAEEGASGGSHVLTLIVDTDAAGDDPYVTAPEPAVDEAPLVGAAADPLGGYTLLAGDQPGLIAVSADQLTRMRTVIRSVGDRDAEDELWDDEDDGPGAEDIEP